MLEHPIRVEPLRLGKEPHFGPAGHDLLLVALDHGADDLDLERERRGRHALEQPEVEKRNPHPIWSFRRIEFPGWGSPEN